MIEIDGSCGGGQLLRTSLSLSAVTGKAFHMVNVRAKREKSGLQPQHLTAVNAVAKICDASLEGNTLRSKELTFTPKKVKGGTFKFDIGTAGSTTLVFQSLLPALAHAEHESEVVVIGGTANPLAPPALEIKEVFLYHLEKLGIKVDFNIEQEGFYPKGGGKIKFTVHPIKDFKEFNLLGRGKYVESHVTAVSSQELEQADVAKRLLKGFKLKFPMDLNLHTKEFYEKTFSTGCYLTAFSSYEHSRLGWTELGVKGKRSEDIGKECAKKLLEFMESNATLDPHTADQLLLYLALAGKGSFTSSEITPHIKTNIKVIELFLPVEFSIIGKKIVCKKKDEVYSVLR